MIALSAVAPAVLKRHKIERRIVLSAVDELLAHGFQLGVDDGGHELALQPTKDRQDIVDAMLNTDEDYLIAYKDGKRFGWIRFVYGNDGWDVICDNTTNLEPFLAKTDALAHSLED